MHPSSASPAQTIKMGCSDGYNLSIIYRNLAGPYFEYYSAEGWTTSGPASGAGVQQSIAMPFTPSGNATVYVIDPAVGYVSGTNTVQVSLYTDNGGVPGTSLGDFSVADLFTFGICCGTRPAFVTSGIPVNGGQQYWVVVQAPSSATDLWGAWYFDASLSTVTFAFSEDGGTTWLTEDSNETAYGVYGTTNSGS